MDPLSFRWLTFQTRYRSEMDFSWTAMSDADRRVKHLRRRMAEWGSAASALSDADDGVRHAIPRGRWPATSHTASPLVVMNEVVSSDLPSGEKYSLLASWDSVLALDLEREANSG